MKTIHISVCDECIAAGNPQDRCGCAVAIGVYRSVAGSVNVFCDQMIIYFEVDGERFVTKTPDEVVKFMNEFDNFRKVDPIEFDLTY